MPNDESHERTEQDEEPRPGRPRVIDKRVSARGADRPAPADITPQTGGSGSDVSDQRPEDLSRRPGETQAETPWGESAAPSGQVWTPEQEAELQRMAQEIAETPSLDWVVNAAATLANVAGTKLELGQHGDASLAIDALAGILNGTSGRLASAETPLRQVLAQLQFGFAQRAAPPPTP